MLSRCNVPVNAIFPIFFLGSAASLQLVFAMVYLDNKIDWALIGMAFFLTTGIYLLNRTLDKEDKFNNLPRWQFFNGKNWRTLFWISFSFVALIFPVLLPLFLQKYTVAFIFAIFSICGLFYSTKIIPFIFDRKVCWVSFKEIPVVKSLVVSVIWGCGALLIAVSNGNLSLFRTDIIVIFSTLFISSLNSTITSDVRDMQGDRLRKIRTIPVLISPGVTFKLLTFINLAGLLAAVILMTNGAIPLRLFYFCFIVISWAQFSIMPQYFFSEKISGTRLELLVDSESVVSAICLGVLSFT